MPAPRKAVAPSPSAKAPPAADNPSSSSTSEDEPVKVSLYDAASLKSALDECAREVVLQSYDEDYTTSNVKIVVGLAAIGCAAYSQFGPGKFPANWWMVFFCVLGYTVLTMALNLYLQYAEGDAFMICKTRRGKVAPRLSSHMERFDDKYTLIMSGDKRKEGSAREVKMTASVTKFFHADGYLSEEAFKPQVEKLLAEFEESGSKKSQ